MMNILVGIVTIILLIVAVVLFRTLSLKPTAAKTAKIELDHSELAREYGRRLSKMVQKETISSRENTDLTKFYDF